jgi:amino acid adenylation domain-containing protein
MPLLQERVTRQASARPDHLALVMKQEALTYAQVEAASNRLARLLRDAGCRRGDRVCLLQSKAPTAIVSMLGVLKADAVYVPLDTASPAPRIARILEATEPRFILAAGPVGSLVAELTVRGGSRVPVGVLDPDLDLADAAFVCRDLEAQSAGALAYEAGPEDPAHILFTSGSTGTPKGVVITHANVGHFLDWAARYFRPQAGERMSGHPPLHFDLSTFDIYGTLAAGAELHLVPADATLLPNTLAEFIRDAALTQWFSVPSALVYMAKFDVVRPGDFESLRRLLWCGEVLPTPILQYWMQRLPHVAFTNLYGPTEATIASSYYTVPACPGDASVPIPIGGPCDGEELLVLDDERREAVPGEAGNLYIKGVGLSPGYWRSPDLTADAFLNDPRPGQAGRLYRTGDLARVGPDGLVQYLGRADSQIKSRGYRIELGEIEAAFNALDLAREAAVVAIRTDGFEGAVICCAFVPLGGQDLTPAALRRALARTLPSYMLPARWSAFAALPKNANGKIDRPRLRNHFEQMEAETRDARRRFVAAT